MLIGNLSTLVYQPNSVMFISGGGGGGGGENLITEGGQDIITEGGQDINPE